VEVEDDDTLIKLVVNMELDERLKDIHRDIDAIKNGTNVTNFPIPIRKESPFKAAEISVDDRDEINANLDEMDNKINSLRTKYKILKI
jgi:vacuolar-type H+-ATPase subunit I/STV1